MNLAKECVKNSVSIDLFLFPNSYIDVATLGLMVTQTGGQIYRYSYFKVTFSAERVFYYFYDKISLEIFFDSLIFLIKNIQK